MIKITDRLTRQDIDASTALAILSGLTLLALAVRIIGLNGGLWLDEIYSLVNQFRLSPSSLLVTFVGDNQHPLYAILASISVSMFGEQAWVIRLPALLFGVASIPALYALGVRIGIRRREALLAAALLALSYHHVWFSQNARGYSIIAFTAIFCTERFLCLLQEQKVRDAWLYALAAALGCYTHLTMVFIVVAQFIVFLLWLPAKRTGLGKVWGLPMLAFFAAGVLTLIFYAPIFLQVVDYFVDNPSGMEGLSTHAWALAETIRSLEVGFGKGVILVGGIAMLLVGLISFYRSNKLAVGIFFCSIVVTFLVAFFARGTMYPRFFFFLAGFFILIGVRGVIASVEIVLGFLLRNRPEKKYIPPLSALVMLVVIAVSALSMLKNYQYPKMDFEGAREWVEQQALPGDVIVTAGVTAWPYQVFYGVGWPEIKTASDIEQLNAETIWIVFAFGRYLEDSAPQVYDIVHNSCMEPKRFHGTLGGGDVIVCRLSAENGRS